jgi:hypothetical protein
MLLSLPKLSPVLLCFFTSTKHIKRVYVSKINYFINKEDNLSGGGDCNKGCKKEMAEWF